MAAQYDAFTPQYNTADELPIRLIEKASVENAIKPIISGMNVLDFACGSGYLTRENLNHGAKHVLGVDISSKMIESAYERARPQDKGKIEYECHDCTKPRVFAGAPFDLVTSVWGLNYAKDSEELEGMFRLISQNLRSGGRFVGLVPTPFEDLESIARRSESAQTRSNMVLAGNSANLLDWLIEEPEGYRVITIGHAKPEPIRLDGFILLRDVYEKAARAGGMKGNLEWHKLDAC